MTDETDRVAALLRRSESFRSEALSRVDIIKSMAEAAKQTCGSRPHARGFHHGLIVALRIMDGETPESIGIELETMIEGDD